MLCNQYGFPDIENMPEIPALPVPDYSARNLDFKKALMNPANKAFRHNAENGHPNFGAYLHCDSNEMVTWGILAAGEYLRGLDTDWIAPTYADFFDEEAGIYLNSPGVKKVEYWYLFYVNTLAGAVWRTIYRDDADAASRIARSADAMLALAKNVGYDFNAQGYDFSTAQPFCNNDLYRQPDSAVGFAYNMLFSAIHTNRSAHLEEAVDAIGRYLAFPENPWYEIPNGSAGLLAGAWLNAHGRATDVAKLAAWVFDHEHGPLQTGIWGGEEVNGLMMGWRGSSRESAMQTAYSMETLMPFQMLLPSVRYCPGLAESVAKYALNALSSFQLFYAAGSKPLHETKPELSADIPYERLDVERDGHSPVACGDFYGHRSIYGAGYLLWIEALARRTDCDYIFALDLSLSDWLAKKTYPVFLLRNPHDSDKTARFTPAEIWRTKAPGLFENGIFAGDAADLSGKERLSVENGEIVVPLAAKESRIVALLPKGAQPQKSGGILYYDEAELIAEQPEQIL